MECNKDEAIRAKEIAEKKMQNKDFLGARKIALKAQQLFPEIENISHILSVCDVHSSPVLFGNEMNWYDILQIEQSANVELIKRQFRKLALLLHPDKNKFPGAESAFQLIGEAQRVLLDQGRRSIYDMKYKASIRRSIPAQSMQHSNRTSDFASKQSSIQQKPEPKKTETIYPDSRQTFWTICHFCCAKFQYYKEILNMTLRCQNCYKTFTARDISSECDTPTANIDHKSNGPAGERPKATKDNNIQASNGIFHGNSEGEDLNPFLVPRTRCASEGVTEHGTDKMGANVNANVNLGKCEEVKLPSKVVRKRKREPISKITEPDSEKEVIIEGRDISRGDASGIQGDGNPNKANVSYNENIDDEEHFVKSRKRGKKSDLSEKENRDSSKKSYLDETCVGNKEVMEEKKENASFKGSLSDGNVMVKEARKTEKSKSSANKNLFKAANDSALKMSPADIHDSEFIMFTDTDFSKFDKKADCFKVGQIWACYDTLDAMPRYYAIIRKVHSPGFKLHITWLDPDPNDEDEIAWVNDDLPVACGKFISGHAEVIESFIMFSHMACWEKHSKRSSYKIYPRMGETWALFKNWGITLKSDLNKRNLEYEFVEILSDYLEGSSIVVARLGKVKGFSCLFCRTEKEGVQRFEVPSSQLLRFSHQVPSFKMSGSEGEGVPEGSFELDPAALPKNLEEIIIPENVELGTGEAFYNDLSHETSTKQSSMGSSVKEATNTLNSETCEIPNPEFHDFDADKTSPKQYSVENSVKEAAQVNSPDQICDSTDTSDPGTYEIPDPEFHDFDADKTKSDFQIGQIWALYSDEDGLPKYYCQIKKIFPDPVFKVQIMWLYPCSLPKEVLQWRHKKEIPISCGRFKLKGGKAQLYDGMDPFSHIIRPEATDKKDEFTILPRKSEIWAVYKIIDLEMKASDLYQCEYEVVEILSEGDFPIKASMLEHVKGFNSVFKGGGLEMEICDYEMLRFSHQIPAFKLTHEKEGTLNGFWELDTAALPLSYFSSN